MTTLTGDTLDAEHSAEKTMQSPPATFTTVSNLDTARAALDQQKAAEEQARQHQVERDAAIVRLHTEDGWNPPRIAREVGVSTSLVRMTLRVAGIDARA